jgi:transposase
VPYEFAEWKKATPGIDYHIALDNHYYSVPYTLIKKTLDVRYTNTIVEVFYRGKRVASHIRSNEQGSSTTVFEHMPKSHQEYTKWTPERIIRWAQNSGKCTAELSEKIIESRKHPQQGFRSCLGIMRLGESYGAERLESACQRALAIGGYSYKSVLSILQNNLDQQALPELKDTLATKHHEYVRGQEYFQ